MAKVKGPLFSIEARGSIAEAMTHFPWKGRNVVRKWIKPAQPRPAAVMNLRIKMKSLGKVSKVFSATSTLKADIIAKTPAGYIWNADWIGVAIKQFQKDNTAWDALQLDMTESTAYSQYGVSAAALGLEVQTLVVNTAAADHPEAYGHNLALYSLAKACWYREVLDENDVAYTNPKAWNDAAVVAFAARIVD